MEDRYISFIIVEKEDCCGSLDVEVSQFAPWFDKFLRKSIFIKGQSKEQSKFFNM